MLPDIPPPVTHPWVLDTSCTPPAYTRQAVGSELLADKVSTLVDGHTDVCMGANFTSSLKREEIAKRARRALAMLRFHCPIIAATMDGQNDGSTATRWLYTPMQHGLDCEAWLNNTFTTLERGSSLNVQEFIDSTVRTRLPVNPSGHRSVFRCCLLSDDTGDYGLYFHGSHSILDAWPTLFALALMFEWMAADSIDRPINLDFGAEWKNLPPDPVSATGGPREAWSTSGVGLFAEAMQRRAKMTPVLAPLVPSRTVYTNGPRVRFEHVFSPSETEKIISVSKQNGFSPTQLLEAAHCLALAASNPELAKSPELDFSAEATIASMEKDLIGYVNKKTHFISAFSMMPIRIPMRKILDVGSTRERLLLTASALKAECVHFQGNPCLPHLLVAQLSAFPLPTAADSEGHPLLQLTPSLLTNLGRVTTRLPSDYVNQTGERILHVHDMCFGHRITTPIVTLHSWTNQDGLHIQLQASDLWTSDSDRAYLQNFLDTMRSIVVELI